MRTCRECGCSDDDACVVDDVPCHWVEIDLCSACAPIPETVLLPCGCRIDCDVIDGENTMIVTACRSGVKCKYVAFALEESRRQGHSTSVIG